MELLTPLETYYRLILRAREMEAQIPAEDPDEDPDNIDDADDEEKGMMLSVLQDELNSGVEEEFRAILEDLADDQIGEVLAIAWIGDGTFDANEWDDARAEANSVDRATIIGELTDMPMLAANLEAGLATFDYSCEGIGQLD